MARLTNKVYLSKYILRLCTLSSVLNNCTPLHLKYTMLFTLLHLHSGYKVLVLTHVKPNDENSTTLGGTVPMMPLTQHEEEGLSTTGGTFGHNSYVVEATKFYLFIT